MEQIHIVSEALYSGTYWYECTYAGLQAGAQKNSIELVNTLLEPGDPLPEATGPLILIGTSIPWIETAMCLAEDAGMRYLVVGGGRPWKDRTYLNCICLDFHSAMYDVVRYLTRCGSRRIALVGVNGYSASDMEKTEHFSAATAHFGLRGSNADIFFNSGSLADSSRHFLTRAQDYDAVVCQNDVAAVALLRAMQEQDIQSPRDLLVVGFGDTLTARLIRPSLTTVTLDYDSVGQQAVAIWRMLRRNPDIVSLSCSVSCKILPGDTTGRCEADPPFPPVRQSEAAVLVPDEKNPFFADAAAADVLGMELLFSNMDLLDCHILRGVWGGLSYEALAESLYASIGTVKYRMKRMAKDAGRSSKDNLLALLRRYFTPDVFDRLEQQKQQRGE